VAEVQDVEDESQSTSESLLVDKAASEEAVDPKVSHHWPGRGTCIGSCRGAVLGPHSLLQR
jgi:hypothetical protein